MLQTKIIIFFTKSFTDDYFSVISIPPGAYEKESLNHDIKRIVFKDGYFTEENHPFAIQQKFSTLGSIIEMYQTS